jgi:hypothetical protein
MCPRLTSGPSYLMMYLLPARLSSSASRDANRTELKKRRVQASSRLKRYDFMIRHLHCDAVQVYAERHHRHRCASRVTVLHCKKESLLSEELSCRGVQIIFYKNHHGRQDASCNIVFKIIKKLNTGTIEYLLHFILSRETDGRRAYT